RGGVDGAAAVRVLRDRRPVRAGAELVEERDDVAGLGGAGSAGPVGTPEDRHDARGVEDVAAVVGQVLRAAAARPGKEVVLRREVLAIVGLGIPVSKGRLRAEEYRRNQTNTLHHELVPLM